MAVASSESSPNTILGTSYRMVQTICIKDIRSMISNDEEVRSDESFCQHDPHPPTFYVSAEFDQDGIFHVGLSSETRDVTITFFKVTIYDDRGRLLSTHKPWKVMKCSSEDRSYTTMKMISLTERLQYNCKFDVSATSASSLRLVVEHEYLAESLTPAASSNADPPKLRLQEEWSHLLDSGADADVTFLVQGVKIPAHKLVLTTRCEYFRSMFDCSMIESASKEVVVPDVEPEAFKGLLRFIYTNEAPKYEGESTMALLSAADKYGVDDLKQMCETTICSRLNAQTVIDALLLAERHHCPTLMASAKAVFGSHASALKSKDEWNKLKESPTLLLKLVEHLT